MKAQEKIQVDFKTYGFASDEELLPHYLYTNNWGVITPLDDSNLFLQGNASYQIVNQQHFKLNAGAGFVLKNHIDDSFLQEIYLRGQLFQMIDFSIGKEAYTSLSYNDTLSVGGFLFNSNARPLPRITIGFYDYVPVGFLNNWVEVRGGISQGWLNDDRTSENRNNSASDVLLHEKWAYARLGKTKIQPYLGLVHSSLFGGTRPDGTKIPIDFWATFLAKGSEKLGGGEATNAAGAHEGFWDFGFYTSVDNVKLQVYYQMPFADGSGMKIWNFRNKDYKLGILAKVANVSWLNQVSFEIIRTDYQSGAGTADPYYPAGTPKEGQIIWMRDIDDFDQFMYDTFGEVTTGWQEQDVQNYLKQNCNHGNDYGGRDDYNNNGSYYNGWTYEGQNIGFPLYHTYSQSKSYFSDWEANQRVIMKNTRVRAVHVGLQGSINNNLDYLLKCTYSKNYGSYSEQYANRESWDEKEGYPYKGGKTECYTYLGLNYQPQKIKQLSFNSSLSYDTGQLYSSFAWMIGINYRFRE